MKKDSPLLKQVYSTDDLQEEFSKRRDDDYDDNRGYRTAGPKKSKANQIPQDNLNRPDFIPNNPNKFNNDKPPARERNYNRNYNNRKQQSNEDRPPRGRHYEKKSGTGLDPEPRKQGHGKFNVGDPVEDRLDSDDVIEDLKNKTKNDKKKNEKDDQEKTPSEEDSESSEYYPEPDEEGNAKKG